MLANGKKALHSSLGRRGVGASWDRDLRGFLLRMMREHGIRPSRALGQHFLASSSVASRVAGLVEPSSIVYEVGCGLGSLTLFLSKTSQYVACCEIDERLARALLQTIRAEAIPNVDIVVADALSLELSGIPHFVVSNTPFVISSRLVARLCSDRGLLKAVLGVQREVGHRLVARPGSDNYGRLTVLAQLCFEVKTLFEVPPEAYIPRPEVSTIFVELKPRNLVKAEDLANLEEVTRALFSLRRKKLSKALQMGLGVRGAELEALLKSGGLSPEQRVYEVPPEGFLRLASLYSAYKAR
jgi:16S rRNA (adenine1518-N6/adenine1519-N6)-dimethyltransferase